MRLPRVNRQTAAARAPVVRQVAAATPPAIWRSPPIRAPAAKFERPGGARSMRCRVSSTSSCARWGSALRMSVKKSRRLYGGRFCAILLRIRLPLLFSAQLLDNAFEQNSPAPPSNDEELAAQAPAAPQDADDRVLPEEGAHREENETHARGEPRNASLGQAEAHIGAVAPAAEVSGNVATDRDAESAAREASRPPSRQAARTLAAFTIAACLSLGFRNPQERPPRARRRAQEVEYHRHAVR